MVRVQTVTVVYVTVIYSRLHKLVCAVVMSSKAYRTYGFNVSLFLSLHPYARAITVWCMMHCKHGTNTAELVVDACDREMIGPVHNHMPFRHTYLNTLTLLEVLSGVIVYASHATSHTWCYSKKISRDDDLKSLVDSIGQQNTGTGMAHDIICTATNRMLIAVGTMLLENRATLLPTICSDFNQHAKDLTAAQGIQEPPELKSISSRWILSEITAKYQHHVTYACKVRKHGTLVYRPTSDLLTVLSEAMWKLKQVNLNVEPVRSEALDERVYVYMYMYKQQWRPGSIGHINKLVHAQIDYYLGTRDHALQDYDELNVDEQIANIDPQLWNAMCCITRSKSEIRDTSKVIDPNSPAYHVKKVRRFFLLCAIMFSTDDRCSMPMHTLMTDLVESQGGSSVLVKTLNRLGVCSSADTLARFIQHK